MEKEIIESVATRLKVRDSKLLTVQIDIVSNPFQFQMDDLFKFGVRKNPKRNFLFVSTLLGKHLAIQPQMLKIAGSLLANIYTKTLYDIQFANTDVLSRAIKENYVSDEAQYESQKTYKLPQKTFIIGFAETATGISESVFSSFSNSFFVHTTRRPVCSRKNAFSFLEEHSHGINHKCFLDNEYELRCSDNILLIDDEITTGNTCRNLIRSITKEFGPKKYTILSILNWCGEKEVEAFKNLESETENTISMASIIGGTLRFDNKDILTDNFKDAAKPDVELGVSLKQYNVRFRRRIEYTDKNGHKHSIPEFSGVFGVDSKNFHSSETEIVRIADSLKQLRSKEKTLCIGSGECIYLPAKIASHMGENVFFQSYTRSPICAFDKNEYPIHNKMAFVDDENKINYLYNIKECGFSEIFVFFDDIISEKMCYELQNLFNKNGIYDIKFIFI